MDRKWIGSADGWLRAARYDKRPSLSKHEEPFNKRRDGHRRRAARLLKQRMRREALESREHDDGYFALC